MKQGGASARSRKPGRAATEKSKKDSGEDDARLEPIGWVALSAWTLALIAASPDGPSLWGINAFRTAAYAWPALLLSAALAWALGRWKPRSPWPWLVTAVALALLLAFPWREKIHLLGDTQLRMRALFAERLPASASLGDWWAWLARTSDTLHASPLDLAVDVLPVVALHGLGVRVADAVAMVGLVLALGFMALAWRLAHRVAPAPSAGPIALALVLTGVLEAFAGYADSAGLLALVAIGWWGEVLVPLERPAQAWRATAWFAALALTHRLGLVMLVPQLMRASGAGLPGDRPAARRLLLGLTAFVIALGVAAAFFTTAGRQLARDLTEIARSARGFQLKPVDVISALMVVAPLALTAPALAGRTGAAFLRDPRAAWIAAGALPLLVGLVWVFPVGENGLGAHRDWDTNVLLGVTLMAGAALVLASAGPRLPAAVSAALPLLALTGLSWVAVNADPGLATRRAVALATSESALTGPQRAHLHVYFGQRAMDERHPEVAAQHYQHAFRDGGNPRRALLAAEAWLMAGRPDEARAAITEARAAGPLSPELENVARQLESSIAPQGRASGR